MVRIIGDHNYRDFLAGEYEVGHVPGALPRETKIGELACAKVYADNVKLIPENEWEDRIRAMKGRFARQRWERFKPPLKYQNGLPWCHLASLAQVVEVNRAIANMAYRDLAFESGGGAVGYRKVGNSLDSSLAYVAKHGFCRRSYVPDLSTNPREWEDGWEEDALLNRPTEWWDVGAVDVWKETVSILLTGMPVYVGLLWWGHAVMYDELVIVDGEICPHSPNTHGDGQDVILKGKKKYPSLGCFAPRVATFSQAQ